MFVLDLSTWSKTRQSNLKLLFFFHVEILSLTFASFKTQVDFWADACLSLGLAFSLTPFRIMARVGNTIH